MADFETDLSQWRDGERRVEEQSRDLERLRVLDRVVGAVERELRRRLGGAYTTHELAELYERGTDWCTDVAARVAPEEPWAWDARLVADAAFARYVRGARDFAGGRRLE